MDNELKGIMYQNKHNKDSCRRKCKCGIMFMHDTNIMLFKSADWTSINNAAFRLAWHSCITALMVIFTQKHKCHLPQRTVLPKY